MKKGYRLIYVLILLIVHLNSCIISNYDEPCIITGKVTDSAGKKIAEVKITTNLNATIDSIISSADGSFKIILPKGGAVDVKFSKAGYTSKSVNMEILGGEKKALDVSLSSLSEDAYFKLRTKEMNISSASQTIISSLYTNVSYDIESSSVWIKCTKRGNEFSVKCDSNEINKERIGFVILKADYNLMDTLKIRQSAGPVLRVLDFIGKNDKTYFPQSRPFVTFSREINVLWAGVSNVDMPYLLSDDKKTIYFDNLKLNAFSGINIQLLVEAYDGVKLSFNLGVKLFINSQSIIQQVKESSFFTADNQFVWIYTKETSGENIVLKQYSTKDFTETKQILNVSFNTMSYNPYNNCLYLIKQVFYEDRYISEISLYDASTGIFKKKIIIDYNGNLVKDIEFSDNGYGIMIVGDNLFYIDSSNNHNFGIFPGNSLLYDSSNTHMMIPSQIEMCNNKVFLLYGHDSSGIYYAYTINSVTKELKTIYSSNNTDFVTSNSGAYALYFSKYKYNKIIYQDVKTTSISTFNFFSLDIGNYVILASEKTLPEILTSDLSVISATDNSIHKFSHQGECYYIKSSNDGKLVLVNNNGTVYLFKSDIFTKYFNNIK